MSMQTQALLIEIGVEEIPAGVAPRMGDALRAAVAKLLSDANLDASELKLGVTPRRLLIHAAACPTMQADREEVLWGPPERVAFADGKPTGAAIGFAKKNGMDVADFELVDKGDGKARYMRAVQMVKGQAVADIIAAAMPDILRKLPSPKAMRWQDGATRNDAFIRPVRWMVARLGDAVIPFSFAGVDSGKLSRGHRMHGSNGELDVNEPFVWLQGQYVMADRDVRRTLIAAQLSEAASAAGVQLVEDDALLDEVTDLTEWPQAVTGRYDADFLRLPEEVSRIELKHHQRCFAARTTEGGVSDVFFAVANIQSKDPAAVALGNERVVNARLADAVFYFDRDPQQSLEARVGRLSEVVFQDGLGMVEDQVRRLRGFVLDNAKALGVDANDAQRAAYLCKSDLSTGLVGEFPELQGYMGGIYAAMDGENEAVAAAITGHYAPAGADDALPESAIARAIGIAERADKLLGYFHLGKIPTASADPYGLRRAAIGLIHLLEDDASAVDMSLARVLEEAAKQWNQQRVTIAISLETKAAVRSFIEERWLGLQSGATARAALEASLHAGCERSPAEVLAVARLLTGFADSETGQAVAAANKRIANILKKAKDVSGNVDASLLSEAAEIALLAALEQAEAAFPEQPEAQLELLASLRQSVDTFFDDVMVMAEDVAVRANRLALLARLRALFLRLADISRL
ncbi:MAG: glycine--tRNA ligase subunit beta [Mariprofundaceae bacterium]|nr:glycine--tRNA ligase subunit beta [Mariprofundaceae bacterium]